MVEIPLDEAISFADFLVVRKEPYERVASVLGRALDATTDTEGRLGIAKTLASTACLYQRGDAEVAPLVEQVLALGGPWDCLLSVAAASSDRPSIARRYLVPLIESVEGQEPPSAALAKDLASARKVRDRVLG